MMGRGPNCRQPSQVGVSECRRVSTQAMPVYAKKSESKEDVCIYDHCIMTCYKIIIGVVFYALLIFFMYLLSISYSSLSLLCFWVNFEDGMHGKWE
jgi:hypothetical protein